jgi:hypothetical protein
VEIGIPGKNEWVIANVTLFSSWIRNGSASMIKIKQIVPRNATIINGYYQGDPVGRKVIPVLQYIGGYEKTKHSKVNDIVKKEWKAFTLNDCFPRGVVVPPNKNPQQKKSNIWKF